MLQILLMSIWKFSFYFDSQMATNEIKILHMRQSCDVQNRGCAGGYWRVGAKGAFGTGNALCLHLADVTHICYHHLLPCAKLWQLSPPRKDVEVLPSSFYNVTPLGTDFQMWSLGWILIPCDPHKPGNLKQTDKRASYEMGSLIGGAGYQSATAVKKRRVWSGVPVGYGSIYIMTLHF